MAERIVTPVLLAAGAGSRFHGDRHKLLAELAPTDSRPAERVIDRSIAAALDAGVGELLVVTGRLDESVLGLPADAALRVVHNPRWRDGQMTSVQVGLAEARATGSSAVAIGLADQPGVEPTAWRAVASTVGPESPIAVATYAGTRGNPVALDRSIWHLLSVGGDAGARGLMRIRGDLVTQVTCEGQPHDIDTVEDLHRWQNN